MKTFKRLQNEKEKDRGGRTSGGVVQLGFGHNNNKIVEILEKENALERVYCKIKNRKMVIWSTNDILKGGL